MGFEESFLYPLVLLLIGSVITIFLVPRFSDRYSKKRHELEIKKDLIVKITELDAEWHIVLEDMAYPVKDDTENARILAKKIGELEKRTSVIQSLLNLYFALESLQTKWEIYSESHFKYFHYLEEREESDLVELAEFLADEKIKSLTGKNLGDSIEKRINIIFEELLEMIEDSKIGK